MYLNDAPDKLMSLHISIHTSQGVGDSYNGLFEDHAATMVHLCGNVTHLQLRDLSQNIH